MLTTLTLNANKAKLYNERIREIKQEHPDFDFTEVQKLSDVFVPYSQVNIGELAIIEADYRDDFDGVYVCGLNSEYRLAALTDYKKVENFKSPLYCWNYGVCDNASQVLDYFDSLREWHDDYMKGKLFTILLTPIFREDQPEYGGWRWHKWGQYIGKFKSRCEYLYDEKGIDYVYCFDIVEIEKQ